MLYLTQAGNAIDHFNSEIKDKYGWRWDNFFAISDQINIEKGAQPVDDILKPDSPDYLPDKAYPKNK